MNIAILTPTRSRPSGLLKLYQSLCKTISGSHNIKLIVGIDNDDPFKDKYENLISRMKLRCPHALSIAVRYGERKLLASLWNDLAGLVSDRNGDYWLMPGNDDMEFLTPEWDIILADEIAQLNHPFHLLWFDDGLQGERHAAFPILSSQWFKELGYFFPTHFHHNYVDTWVFDIAQQLKVARYIPRVKNQHRHYSIGMHEYDLTYQQGNTHNSEDETVFAKTRHERQAEVIKLQIKINQWKQKVS